ncbi:MAG: hypothetical protein HOG08_02920 [Candidatus Magasanikbacteria bacterium]|jgi:hypothetical protein|nr:hypothetical protein [Candidatus Magasanikbacteria bacterium]
MKKEPTYRKALSHAWRVVRYHPSLWVFGLFSLFLGQMGLLDFFTSISMAEKKYELYPLLFDLPELWNVFLEFLGSIQLSADGWIWLVWLVLFFISAWVFFLFISVTSQGALISGISQSLKRGKFHHVKIDKAWHAGLTHFWRLLGLNALKKCILGLLATSIGFATYNVFVSYSAIDGIVFVLLFLLATIVGMILSLLVIYAAGYVVIEEYSFTKSIEAAWKLFLDHWLVSLEVGLMVLLLNVAIVLAAIVLVVLFVIEMGLVFVLSTIVSSLVIWKIGLFISTLLLIVLFAIIGSLFSVYVTSVWTYLFLKMHKTGLKSRVFHFLGM